jgi:hypothetical protein
MMPSTDITFCARECGNMECERNRENLPYEINYFVSMADFKDCKEWREKK